MRDKLVVLYSLLTFFLYFCVCMQLLTTTCVIVMNRGCCLQPVALVPCCTNRCYTSLLRVLACRDASGFKTIAVAVE